MCGVQFTIVNWTFPIGAYSFDTPNLYAAMCGVQFTIVNWTFPIGAYSFDTPNLYAAMCGVQFTIVNWTFPIGAYSFDTPNLYAAMCGVQFTIVNWTHTVEYANLIGEESLMATSVVIPFSFPDGRLTKESGIVVAIACEHIVGEEILIGEEIVLVADVEAFEHFGSHTVAEVEVVVER